MAKKKYHYFYPEIKELGDQLRGTSAFIRKMIDNKYSQKYIIQVMRGERKNESIVAAMKHLIEVSKAKNY